MKYYFVSGEASGDLHASNLAAAIKQLDADAKFRGFGGDLLRKEGMEIVKHYRELAFMGFTEVIMNLRTIFSNMKVCVEDIKAWKPDVVILVDYPGFNLRIAGELKKAGIKVFYYISPQVWAWKQSRVKKIREVVDKMFVILPFEKEFYAKWNYEVEFVGHPLLDEIAKLPALDQQSFRTENNLSQKPIIALLPGSRKQEIKVKLPVMLSVMSQFPDHQFVIAGAPSIQDEYYRALMPAGTKLVTGKTYSLLRCSEAALVTSGTATLETALLNIPEVVCYKGSPISYQIAKRLIKVRFISLVNLIMDREVVKELIQTELNTQNVVTELKKIVEGGTERQRMLNDYNALRITLGEKGASEKTARLMLKTLQGRS